MLHDISIKDFRANISRIADLVKEGKAFRVFRRSHLAFKVVPPETNTSEEEWETVIDFTENGKTKGVPITRVLQTLRKLNR